jgi:hypothetical protein
MPDTYYHLKAVDYPTAFPVALDAAPVLVQKRTFIDGWIFNRMCSMLQSIQQYCIDNKATLEG